MDNNNFGNITKKVKSLITIRNSVNIVMIVIIGFILGLNSFIITNFNFNNIEVYKIFLRTSLTILSVLVASNIAIDKGLIEDEPLNKEMSKSYNYEKLIDVDFSEFLVKHNLDLKTKKYIEELNKKIHKLDKKATPRDKFLYFSKKLTDTDVEERKFNQYCIDRAELMDQIDKDFIKDNIAYLEVQYEEVHEIDLRIPNPKYLDNDSIKLQPEQLRARLLLNKVIFGLFLSVITSMTVITFVEDGFTGKTFLTLLLDALTVMTSIIFGLGLGQDIINISYTGYYVKKNRLYEKYFEYNKSHGGESKVKKLLQLVNAEVERTEGPPKEVKKV